nr:hypothetical protein GCM10020093_019520 [Planobispora longispora]
MQAARGHARVQVGGVRGERLQQVEDVQVNGARDPRAVDVEAGTAPQAAPGRPVPVEQFAEAGARRIVRRAAEVRR